MQTCGQCKSFIQAENYALPASPVPNLMGTNAAASEAEAKSIRATLRQMHSDLTRFDAEICRLQHLLERLIATKPSIEEGINQHKALISPLRLLPPEILSKIFLLSTSGRDVLYPHRDVCGYRKAVQLPGSVCAWWRRIAVSTPQLWSHIEICFPENMDELRGEGDLFETWLLRSSSCPLSVYLQSPTPQTESHPMLAICQSIAAQSNRLKSANLQMSRCFLDALRPIRGNLPILECLQLRDTTLYHEVEDGILSRPSIDLFATAPSLRRLDIKFQNPDLFGTPSWQAIPVPWTQLTFLSLSIESSCNDYYSVFSQTPNLVDCEIYSRDPHSPLPHETIRLLYLHSITIFSLGDISDLLDRLEVPELMVFGFKDRYSVGIWPHSSLISLISRSSCRIHTLDVTFNSYNSTFHEDNLIAILQNIPSLKDLRLSAYAAVGLGEEALRRLRRQHGAQELAPQLEHIQLRPYTLSLPRQELLDMAPVWLRIRP